MSGSLFIRCTAAIVTGTALLIVTPQLVADENAESPESQSEITEEIIVYAPRLGGRIDLDARYEELLRSNLIKQLDRTREMEEENRWRLSLSLAESSSRIKWGYDLDAELRIRRNTKLLDLPIDDNKPATIFRFQFK